MSALPIFIVGCPRSGTTLLRNLLRSHPNLTFPRESHFIPSFYRAYGDPVSDAEAIALARRLLALLWIRRWELDVTPEQFAGCRTFRALTTALFETWARKEGKPRWGDKTPQYVTEIPILFRLFPDARVIHIYRDGRDVACSWLKTKLEPENVYTAARLWRSYVMAGRQDGRTMFGDAYLEVQYERLVDELPETMQSVCEFLQEPFCEDVLRPSPLPQGKRIRAMSTVPTDVVSKNSGRWMTEMRPRHRVLFESVAGDLLETLGYQVEGRRRHVSGIERLAWQAHHTTRSTIRKVMAAANPVGLRTAWQFRMAKIRER